jgi:uncharacterized membrane protein
MANTTVAFGAVLMVLGIASYFGSNMVSLTALIPTAFGLVLLVLGVIARDPNKRKHAMHVAAMIGLLGFAGSVSGLLKVLTGNLGPRPNAAIAQAVMAGLMLIFVAMCVRSFINARRSRTV